MTSMGNATRDKWGYRRCKSYGVFKNEENEDAIWPNRDHDKYGDNIYARVKEKKKPRSKKSGRKK